MARTVLPTFPAIILGIVEPFLLILATVQIVSDPKTYFTTQAPSHPLLTSAVPQQGVGTAMQLANIFVMLAFFAIVCVWTTHPEIAKYYCLIVALGDWGHMYAFYRATGAEYFFNVAGWHRPMYEQVGISVILNLVRLGTVAGVFGPIGPRRDKVKSR